MFLYRFNEIICVVLYRLEADAPRLFNSEMLLKACKRVILYPRMDADENKNRIAAFL